MFKVLRSITGSYFKRQGPLLAKGIAYSILIGSIPFLFITISSASYIYRFSKTFQLKLDSRLHELFPEPIARILMDQAKALSETGTNEIGILGVVMFFLVARSIFGSIERSLATMMRNNMNYGIFWNHLVHFGLTILAFFLFYAASYMNLAISFLYNFLNLPPSLSWIAGRISTILMITLVLIFIYRFSYGSWGRPFFIIPLISLLVAVFWQMLNFLSATIISGTGNKELMYGVLAVVVIFLFWTYVFSFILLLGGVTIEKLDRKAINV